MSLKSIILSKKTKYKSLLYTFMYKKCGIRSQDSGSLCWWGRVVTMMGMRGIDGFWQRSVASYS